MGAGMGAMAFGKRQLSGLRNVEGKELHRS